MLKKNRMLKNKSGTGKECDSNRGTHSWIKEKAKRMKNMEKKPHISGILNHISLPSLSQV